MNELKWNTVNSNLRDCLEVLMKSSVFLDFRLVGGTALSLQLGHRISIDIDLFSDIQYGTIDFTSIENFLDKNFPIVFGSGSDLISFGKSYFIGKTKSDLVKLDVYSTELFNQDFKIVDGIQLATVEEIATMKLEVISNGGRKKDFWDLHELLEYYSLNELFDFHKSKYSYVHNRDVLVQNLTNFQRADFEPDPNCLLGKYWELIKLDLTELVQKTFIDN